MAHTQVIPASSHSPGLAEVLERVLDKGLVIAGDIKIKLCDIELLSIQIRLLVCSVDKAKEMGLTWWWQEHAQRCPPPHQARSLTGEPRSPPELDAPGGDPWREYLRFRDLERTRQ